MSQSKSVNKKKNAQLNILSMSLPLFTMTHHKYINVDAFTDTILTLLLTSFKSTRIFFATNNDKLLV